MCVWYVVFKNTRSARRIARVELLGNEIGGWSTAIPSANHTASNGLVSTIGNASLY